MAYIVGLRHVPKPQWKLEEALEFLNGPGFIPAASDPAQIEFEGPRHFKFSTPSPAEVAADRDRTNHIVTVMRASTYHLL